MKVLTLFDDNGVVCCANLPDDVWNTYGDALIAQAKMTVPPHGGFDLTADDLDDTNRQFAERNLTTIEDAQVWIRTTGRTEPVLPS